MANRIHSTDMLCSECSLTECEQSDRLLQSGILFPSVKPKQFQSKTDTQCKVRTVTPVSFAASLTFKTKNPPFHLGSLRSAEKRPQIPVTVSREKVQLEPAKFAAPDQQP